MPPNLIGEILPIIKLRPWELDFQLTPRGIALPNRATRELDRGGRQIACETESLADRGSMKKLNLDCQGIR